MKDLYLADSLDKLKQKSEFKISTNYKFEQYMVMLQELNVHATKGKVGQDEELQFLYLHRYNKLFCHLKNFDEFKKKVQLNQKFKEQLRTNMEEYERLLNNLILRYKKLQKGSTAKTPEIENGVASKEEPIVEKKIAKPKTSIDCKELFHLLNGKNKSSFLILDCRSEADFEDSHIDSACVINVPEEKMQKGFSGVKVGSILSAASQGLWTNRTSVEVLILLDWNSTVKTLNPNSAIFYLKDAITQWDPINIYKTSPVILEGGYETLVATFPYCLTNIKPRARSTSNQPSLIMPDTFDYPMSFLEQEKVEVHKPISKNSLQRPLIIDRSTKPKVEVKPTPPPAPLTPPEPVEVTAPSDSDSVAIDTDEYPSEPEAPSPDISQAKEIPHSGEPHDSGASSIPETPPSSLRPALIEESTLRNLRKLKPAPEPKVHGSPQKTVTKESIDNDIYSTPLKKEGGGGILKRASSSPNIAQMKDDASFKERPAINRETKPSSTRESLYSERIDATYGTTTNGLTGLKNFANNCYMNSIIQCLSNTEALVKDLIHLNKPAFNRNSKTKGKVAQEVINTLRCMWSGEIRINTIKPLKTLMGEIKDIFKGSAQQDSNEFLIILLEHLHDDLNIPCESSVIDGADVDSGEKSWGEFKRKNCSVIQRLFYGQQKSTVTCSTCFHASVTFEPFFNLFVPLPNSNTTASLNDCIQLYMSGERITGWKCPKCEVERNATKKFDISRLPPILIIALKRFTQENDSWLHKKENMVVYPLEGLDMEQFTVKDSEQRYTKYNLYAMSTHIGTLGAGHYRAICKNYLTQKWYMFDDQSVDLLSPSSVKNNSEVYILFYAAAK